MISGLKASGALSVGVIWVDRRVWFGYLLNHFSSMYLIELQSWPVNSSNFVYMRSVRRVNLIPPSTSSPE